MEYFLGKRTRFSYARDKGETDYTDWGASTDYAVGDYVTPTTPNGYVYECTADAGSSAASEPTFPTTIGSTVVDDGITWTCRGLYGIANPATTWSYIPVQSFTPNSKSEVMPISTLDSTDSRNVDAYFETLRTIGGSLEGLVQHFRFLTMAWGSDSNSSGTHTIGELDDIPSFSLNVAYQHTTPHAIDMTGCKINRLDLACSKGEFLKFTAEIIGQKSADHDVRAYQSLAAMKYYPTIGSGYITPYAYSDVEIEINGVNYSAVDSVKMTINNNLLAEPVLDSSNAKRIAEPIPQIREYSAAFVVKMATDDLYDLWNAGAEIGTDPTVVFTRTAVTDLITFTLEDCVMESAISPYKITEGVVLVEIPLKVKKISVVEVNTMDVDYDAEEA